MAKTNKKEAPNYAHSDPEFAKEFADRMVTDWNTLRADRLIREIGWKEYYDAWALGNQDHGARRNYKGRANLNFPQIRKEVETMSRRLVKGLFSDDYLGADPTLHCSSEMVTANVQIMRHFFDGPIKIKSRAMPWVKQGVILGSSPIRQFWHKEVNDQFFRKRVLIEDKTTGNLIPSFTKTKEQVIRYNAPKLVTADLFNTWVYPSTAESPEEIQRTYFRTKVTYDFLMQKYKEGTSINPEFLKDEGKEGDVEFAETQERMAAMGESGVKFGHGATKLYDLLEVWGTEEIDGEMLPFVLEVINGAHPIRLQQNPFWHQQAPFDWMRFIPPPGNDFYGRGLPEASISAQAALDDTLNQSMDATTLALNNVTIVNPAYAPNVDSFEIEPNAIWWADPNAIKQFTFPDLSDIGLKNVMQLRSMITEMSDNQPQLPDPIAGKARSTGQAELAMNEWQTDIFMIIQQVALEGLVPMTQKAHALLQQYLDDNDVYRIAGKYSGHWVNRVVTPTDLIGQIPFKWIGSIQVENRAIKVQQMLNFLKVLQQMPPESGIKLKYENFIIKLLRDGFQIRDVENIIESPNMNSSTPPYIENKILSLKGDVSVESGDDDDLHILEHKKFSTTTSDRYVRAKLLEHITKHEMAKKRKEEIKQMQMMQMQMMQAQGGPQRPQQKRPQGAGPNPNGNQTQIPQAMDKANLERGMRP